MKFKKPTALVLFMALIIQGLAIMAMEGVSPNFESYIIILIVSGILSILGGWF